MLHFFALFFLLGDQQFFFSCLNWKVSHLWQPGAFRPQACCRKIYVLYIKDHCNPNFSDKQRKLILSHPTWQQSNFRCVCLYKISLLVLIQAIKFNKFSLKVIFYWQSFWILDLSNIFSTLSLLRQLVLVGNTSLWNRWRTAWKI